MNIPRRNMSFLLKLDNDDHVEDAVVAGTREFSLPPHKTVTSSELNNGPVRLKFTRIPVEKTIVDPFKEAIEIEIRELADVSVRHDLSRSVLRILMTHGELSVDEVAYHASVSAKDAAPRLSALVALGLVQSKDAFGDGKKYAAQSGASSTTDSRL